MKAVPAPTSADVEAYSGMVEAHAFRFSRLPEMQNDEDDFVQEGLLSVFEALKDGEKPSNVVVTNRMSNWAKLRRRQMRGSLDLDEIGEPMLARLAV